MGNGEFAYALHEVVVTSSPVNKYNDRTFLSQDYCVHVRDNTYVDTKNLEIKTEYDMQRKMIERNIIDRLLKTIISCYQADEFSRITRNDRQNNNNNSSEKKESIYNNTKSTADVLDQMVSEFERLKKKYGDPSNIQIDVSNPHTMYQQKFSNLKQKIESRSVSRGDFSADNLSFRCRKEIDEYFACFDKKDPNYMWKVGSKPGFGESLIPIWGSAKSAEYHYQNGEYWYGIGYTLLAISDLALLSSFGKGIAKGGLKALGKNYKNWSGNGGWRGFYGKSHYTNPINGKPIEPFAKSGQEVHHWFWKRNGQKSGTEFNWWAKNQMWNLIPLDAPIHTSVHGWGVNAFGPINKFWYGTPNWFKAGTFSTAGHSIDIINSLSDE